MKEAKTKQVKVRLTPTEKEAVDKYCEQKNISVSDLLRIALNRMINQEVK